MPKLDSEQKRIVRLIRREGRHIKDPRVRRVYERAAVQTGIVESGLRNLDHGDADSQGWRQERASLYPNPTNLKASVRRFRQEFQQHYDPGEKSYDVAAQVQRPAAQYIDRYRQEAPEARQILRQVKGSPGTLNSGGRNSRLVPTYGMTEGVDNSALRQDLKLSYLQDRGNPNALLDLALGLKSAQDVPGERVQTGTRVVRRGGNKSNRTNRNPHPTSGKGELIGTPYAGTHTLGNWQSDNAIDVGVKEGTKIRSVGNAVVEKVSGGYSGGSSRFDGYQVTLRTKNNQVFYTHLKSVRVKPGQKLKRGEVIGRSGSANGVPHLHMGVERGDPRRYI